jgi:hypothetical protein
MPAGDSTSLVFTGPPLELRLPSICAHCATPAPGHIVWRKVFEDRDDESTSYTILAARAPFCPACIARHERELKRFTPLDRLLLCLRSGLIIPALCSGGLTLWLTPKFLPGVFGSWPGNALSAAVPGLFSLIALGSFLAAWRDSERHAVPPLTSITASFGFSRDIAGTFEGVRHRYTLANPDFAAALLAANEDKTWRRTGPKAQSASRKRMALYVIFGIAVAATFVWDLFYGD